MSSSTRARSAAARASLTPPGYNSFSARASSGFANAARYAAASDFACCTPFQSSRASSPLQGSFICAASHGGGSWELLTEPWVAPASRRLCSFCCAAGDDCCVRAGSAALESSTSCASGSIWRICSSVSANRSCAVLSPFVAAVVIELGWFISTPKQRVPIARGDCGSVLSNYCSEGLQHLQQTC